MMIRFEIPGTGEPVLLNAKESGVVVLTGNRDVMAFSRTGRLRYATSDSMLLKRGLDNRILRFDENPGFLSSESSLEYIDRAYRNVETLYNSAPPAARKGLLPAIDCTPERLAREGDLFRSIYGRISVLPPDQYQAIYLQATIGCSHNRCSFCSLYQDIPFHISTVDEFEGHVRSVKDLLGIDAGGYSSIFLGDANALSVPLSKLLAMMEIARELFPGEDFHAFTDARLHRTKSVRDLCQLASSGLRRVTFGLETGSPSLYNSLRKPGTLADAAATIHRVKDAALSLGITLLVGVGGIGETVDFLESMPLSKEDIVYLSPLESQAEPGDSVQEFRESLSTLGVKVAKYGMNRFVY